MNTQFFYSPSVPIIFPQVQKSDLPVLSNRVFPVSLRMHKKTAEVKPAKHKKISRGKILKQCLPVIFKLNILEAKKRRSGVW